MRKTIAEHMRDVLLENECDGVMFGDTRLLDQCAQRCTHTNLMDKHPMLRHTRILTACENSELFVKRYYRPRGIPGNSWWRSLFLKEEQMQYLSELPKIMSTSVDGDVIELELEGKIEKRTNIKDDPLVFVGDFSGQLVIAVGEIVEHQIVDRTEEPFTRISIKGFSISTTM